MMGSVPAAYEAARAALAKCVKLDECKEWADKAAAMEIYARQAKDREWKPTPSKYVSVPNAALVNCQSPEGNGRT